MLEAVAVLFLLVVVLLRLVVVLVGLVVVEMLVYLTAQQNQVLLEQLIQAVVVVAHQQTQVIMEAQAVQASLFLN
jgi:hypothetical protein